MSKSWKFFHPFFEYKQGLENVEKPWDGGNFFEYNWDLYPTVFKYKEDFKDYNLPWTGHTFFAYDLVRNLEPERIVELGTFKGTSLYSFSQAAKDSALDTEIFAVDTWEGEEQTGEYGDEVYDLVRKIVRKHYPEQNVKLLRMLFNETVKEFKDESIDILHIDGLHTYEAVKDDYNTWKDKVKKDGVIIFHDVNVSDFGVCKVFEEAIADNPNSIGLKFKHNYGLGVLFKSAETVSELKNKEYLNMFIEVYKFIAMGSLKAEEHKYLMNEIKELKEEVKKKDEHIEFLNKSLNRKSIKLVRKILP